MLLLQVLYRVSRNKVTYRKNSKPKLSAMGPNFPIEREQLILVTTATTVGSVLFSIRCTFQQRECETFGFLSRICGVLFTSSDKGTCHLRFSGIRPLRGYPPPLLTENQSEKKKVFFLSRKGGFPPPPLTESPLSFSGKFFPKRAKNDVFFIK